jgi:hypothetical protein
MVVDKSCDGRTDTYKNKERKKEFSDKLLHVCAMALLF